MREREREREEGAQNEKRMKPKLEQGPARTREWQRGRKREREKRREKGRRGKAGKGGRRGKREALRCSATCKGQLWA